MGDSEDRELMSRLQNLQENELTKRVLKPLFFALGYERVEYYGGADEEGKDLVCWRLDEFGDNQLSVVQVKKFRPSRRAADKASFAELVVQLSTATEKELPHISGATYLPTNLYVITPFEIDTKVLKSRFEGYRHLRNVRIIDGLRLAQAIRQRLPSLARQLCGPTFDIATRVLPELNNDALMQALDARTGRDLRTFYTDLDLAIGKKSNRFVLLSDCNPQRVRFSLTEVEWQNLLDDARIISCVFGIDPFNGGISEIDDNLARQRRQNDEQRLAIKSIEDELLKISEQQAETEDRLRLEEARIRANDPEIEQLENKRNQLQAKLHRLLRTRSSDEPRETPEEIEAFREIAQEHYVSRAPSTAREVALDREFSALNAQIAQRLSEIDPIRDQLTRIRENRRRVAKRKTQATNEIRPLRYESQIDGWSMLEGVLAKRRELVSCIENYNRQSPSTEDLRTFLLESEAIFQAGARILEDPIMSEALGLRADLDVRGGPGARLSVPVSKVIDTGINLILLGDPGAGKTTSLQNYAATRLRNARSGELSLFAPLARIIDCWSKEDGRLERRTNTKLEYGLAEYLGRSGVHLEIDDLKTILEGGRCILLLDAIDEVIKKAPWIISAIGSLANRYPKTQIVTSSRLSAKGIENLPFTVLTLLPFTNDQRGYFINSWFKDEPAAGSDVLLHLRRCRELDEIVRNPLLATILCVLREHNIPLPDNELRLYEERMRLLVGNYDLHKGVQRVSSKKYFLSLAAQRLAFRLHCLVRRDATREELYEWAAKSLHGQLTATESQKVVDELIDPCNVLCPMTTDGRLGFGHLRYQEYLAALELLQNRGVDLADVARQPWWRGVMILFSQMNQDIGWFVKYMIDKNMLGSVKELVLAIIAARPGGERARLKKIVAENIAAEEERMRIKEENLLDWEHDDDSNDPWS